MARGDIYECRDCASAIEVLRGGEGGFECCGKPMTILSENTTDASKEKHVPAVEKIPGGYRVTVGSVPHPMEEKHYIEWIELVAEGASYRKFLKPGDAPTADFAVAATTQTAGAAQVSAREHCTLHGLWKA
jgi:superoxide reductase